VELRDRIVRQSHFFVRNAEVVMGPEIPHLDRRIHLIFEGLEDLVDRLLALGLGGGIGLIGHPIGAVLGLERGRDRREVLLVEPVPPTCGVLGFFYFFFSRRRRRAGARFERVERCAVRAGTPRLRDAVERVLVHALAEIELDLLEGVA